jgi:hypothetical protein
MMVQLAGSLDESGRDWGYFTPSWFNPLPALELLLAYSPECRHLLTPEQAAVVEALQACSWRGLGALLLLMWQASQVDAYGWRAECLFSMLAEGGEGGAVGELQKEWEDAGVRGQVRVIRIKSHAASCNKELVERLEGAGLLEAGPNGALGVPPVVTSTLAVVAFLLTGPWNLLTWAAWAPAGDRGASTLHWLSQLAMQRMGLLEGSCGAPPAGLARWFADRGDLELLKEARLWREGTVALVKRVEAERRGPNRDQSPRELLKRVRQLLRFEGQREDMRACWQEHGGSHQCACKGCCWAGYRRR